MIWPWVVEHIQLLVQIALPFGFVLLDLLLKWTGGKTIFRDIGADVCRAGTALYIGTVLGLIQHSQLREAVHILSALFIAAALCVAWWLCVMLSYQKIPIGNRRGWQEWVAVMIGSGATYFAAGLSWELAAGNF